MKVLFIGTTDFGGVSSYVSDLIKNSNNIKFYLLKDSFMDESNLKDLYPNCTFIKFNQNYSFYFIRSVIRLRRHIIKSNIDLVHAHTLRAGFQAAICKYFFCRKIKLVYTGHGLRFTQKKKYSNSLIFMFLERVTNLISDKVVFIREIDLNLSLTNKITSPSKSIYIKTRISPPIKSMKKIDIREEFDINTKYIVANAGSIYDLKNPELFIEIAKRTISLYKNITFIWFGEGDTRQRINQVLKAKGLTQYIKFVGPVKKELMLSVYSQIDVFLLTSKVETFPTVILEAYMFQKLVFSSSFKGVEEIIKNGKTGVVFDEINSQNIHKYLVELLHDRKSYNTISKKGFDFFQNNFSDVNEFAEIHTKIYKQLIS